MERVRTSGLSLRGSGYDLGRSRSNKKMHVKTVAKRRHGSDEPAPYTGGDMVTVMTVDTLMQELRRAIHAMFCHLDPSISTTNWYDNCSRQAFKFFTTTNTITSDAFFVKVSRLGVRASRSLCMELFGRIDQDDLGEINYATFSRRIFLPEPFFAINPSDSTPNEFDDDAASSTTMSEDSYSRPQSAKANGGSSPAISPKKRVGTAARDRGTHSSSPRSPSLGPSSAGMPYELMTLDRLAKCILLKLDERVPPGEAWFERAFSSFSRQNSITFADFHGQLDQLQITLSPSKARVLFDRLDYDKNGVIDRAEFSAGFSRIREYVMSSIDGYASRSDMEDADRKVAAFNAGSKTKGLEVEAGASLSIKQVMAKLRDKIEQHTSKESDRFRQAFKIFSKSSGITPYEFNIAMGKLGLKLSGKQLQDLFDIFDFDKSGDLDLNEFVQGVMLDDNSTAFWSSARDRQKIENANNSLYSMAAESVRDSWTIKDVEQMLREKIEQRTSKSSDCFRQAFKIFKKVNGIKPDEFHRSLESIGLTLSREQADVLFNRFDKNGSGDIDLDEFIHGVLPPDYIGLQWMASADEMHRIAEMKKKVDIKARPDHYMTEIDVSSWSLNEIETKIRDKIEQSTSKSSDIFRQAFKIFKKSSSITKDEFRERLLALGFRLTPEQCSGLFDRYDVNRSNDIDLQEFCMRILPPDYTGDGDYWSHSDRYKKEMRRQKIEYARRTKNGLLMLPRFEDTRRYTRGQYTQRTFEDLKNESAASCTDDTNSIDGVIFEKPAPLSPAMSPRPPTPSTPRTPRPPTGSTASSPRRTSNPSLTSIQADVSEGGRTPSPRKMRMMSSNGGQDVSAGPRSSTLAAQPTPPHSPRVARPPPSGGQVSNQATVATGPMSPRKPETDIEYEDEEELDEQVEELETALRLLKESRDSRRHHKSSKHRHRHSGDKDGRDNSNNDTKSTSYASSVRGAESVSGESTRSALRGIGGAKYTPQRGHALLLKRFMHATKTDADAARKGGSKSHRRRP